MNEYNDVYAKYNAMSAELAALLNDSSDVISILNMNQYKANLKGLGNKVSNDSFKIQIVGTFKNGKSTFINSFLGKEILPAYATPCTAVINEVKYGDAQKAKLYFKDPLPEKLPSEIPAKTLEHMKKYNMKNIPTIEISYDEIEDYAVIPIGKDPKEMLMESPYEKIELFWPLDILKNKVEIIDSPGLNEHATRTKVTTDYLSKADAVIFVLTATALCSADEMTFIENDLKKKGFEDVYFIVNRFDLLRTDKDKENIKKFAKVKLSDQTNFGDDGIFFISALNALEGKENNNVNLYKNSGMLEFEKTLSDFLVHQKGKVKLSQPAKELKRILNDEVLFKVLPQQMNMLNCSLDDIKKRYETAKPKLDQLIIKKNQMKSRIDLLIEQMMPDIRRCITNYYTDLNTNLPVWVKDYETKTKFSMLNIKNSSSDMVTEISEHIKNKIEEEQNIWIDNTLQPMITDKVQNMLTSIENNLENFFVEIDNIKINITGVNNTGTKEVPLWQRITAIGGGLLIGDIGVAALGGVTGLNKTFVKGLVTQIGAYIGLSLFGLLNPVTIILVIAGSIIGSVFSTENEVKKRVKAEVVSTTLSQINETAPDITEKIINDVRNKITEISSTVINSMDTEIKEIDLQVKDIISQMEKGQADIDKRKAVLKECENKVKNLNNELDKFIFQLIA